MSIEDPGFWKQAADYLWAVLLIPVAALWRKVDTSVSRDELNIAMNVRDKATEESRRNVIKLFEAAEHDRRMIADKFEKTQNAIHTIHVDIINRLIDRG